MVAVIDRNFSPRFNPQDFTWTFQVTADSCDLPSLHAGTHPGVHLWPGEIGFQVVDAAPEGSIADFWVVTVQTVR